jgi:transcriptional regulator with GAF, ATPase, and Fis domain
MDAADDYTDRVVSALHPLRVVDRQRGAEPAKELRTLHGKIAGLIGRSPAMLQVCEQVARLGSGSAPVLIVGETGTGKELIARAIHDGGLRRAGPLVAVNCAGLPRDLIESELLGYKRGAFSGAVTDHLGLLRAASGGTLLRDEITEMSPELQAKLLRAVLEQMVRPIGSIAEVRVDVRFVASSNRDVDEALRSGQLALGPVLPAVGRDDHGAPAARSRGRRRPPSRALRGGPQPTLWVHRHGDAPHR